MPRLVGTLWPTAPVVVARLEGLRSAAEAQLRSKDSALDALRADTAARLEDARALQAGLHDALRARQEEVQGLNTRAGEQAELLEAAFARRDVSVKQLTAAVAQLVRCICVYVCACACLYMCAPTAARHECMQGVPRAAHASGCKFDSSHPATGGQAGRRPTPDPASLNTQASPGAALS